MNSSQQRRAGGRPSLGPREPVTVRVTDALYEPLHRFALEHGLRDAEAAVNLLAAALGFDEPHAQRPVAPWLDEQLLTSRRYRSPAVRRQIGVRLHPKVRKCLAERAAALGLPISHEAINILDERLGRAVTYPRAEAAPQTQGELPMTG